MTIPDLPPTVKQQPASRHVLVVDDDPGVRLMARAALESSGFSVTEAQNGREGLEQFQSTRPDLVLVDVMMPEMDGYEMCQAIRQLPGGEHVPLVIMTGRDDAEAVRQAYDIGVTDFITKPLGHLLLVNRLEFLLRATQTANELRASEERLNQAYAIAGLGYWEWHPRSGSAWASERIYEIFGMEARVEGENMTRFLSVVHPDDREEVERTITSAANNRQSFSLEHRIVRPDGSEGVVVQEAAFVSESNRQGRRMMGTVQDITSRRRSEEQIRYLAYYDKLTGLPNRSLFTKYLSHAIANGRRYGRNVAVLHVDLDHFRRYNETLGQQVGDGVLREVAKRLRACIRADQREAGRDSASGSFDFSELAAGCDAVGHFGRDEFVIALTETHEAEDAVFVVQRIREALARRFDIEGNELHLTASIGISAFPLTGDSADLLIRHAEVAARHAKARGRDRHEFFSGTLNLRAFKKLSVETQLRKALDQSTVEVHYQPRVNVQRDEVVGMEALARLPASGGGYIPADEFISVAEETGLILPLGEYVMQTAFEQAKRWHDQGFEELKVAINLSAGQFTRKNFAAEVARALCKADISPQRVELELTEGVLIDDTDTSLAVLHQLRELGVDLAVDDFGTGYSSLGYLKRFPLTTLKLDRSFVRDILTNADDAAIVHAVVTLGHSLRLNVVAEGAEVPAQVDALRDLSCDEVQGHVFSKALAPRDFEDWLLDRRSAAQTGAGRRQTLILPRGQADHAS